MAEEDSQELTQESPIENGGSHDRPEQKEAGEHKPDEYAEAMLDAAKYLHTEMEKDEAELIKLRERQVTRQQRRAIEMERLAELRRVEEQRRKEEEAEKRRIKEEAKEIKRLEKEKKQREKEERAKNIGKKNFTVKKSETSSLDEYEHSQEKTVEMAKTKEQLDEEKRVALSQRIVPLDISGMDTTALIAKAKELHEKLYRLESEKYDLDDRFKRQQYDMMELAERARQMNKGGRSHSTRVKIQDEPSGPCPFDRLADKFPNVPERVVVASKYERNVDRRNFFEKMGVFESEWLGSDSHAGSEVIQDC
ncbi:troponin T, skeletal muscle-like isoform X2 [Watersipora subatra]|uniref:troponin T, skeletal muscle-like isoform X2 n=1 Tax=Watersipora subatra TaxID=2589382 RepID=UPI00355AD0DB